MRKHGSNISNDDAKQNILNYINDYKHSNPSIPENDMVVGHRFDFSLIQKFVEDIKGLIENGVDIDSIRIYYAKSTRTGDSNKLYDVVLVPTLSTGADYRIVYEDVINTPDKFILGHSTPCPNVCNENLVYLVGESA